MARRASSGRPSLLLGRDLQQLHEGANPHVQWVGRVHGALVVPVVEEDILPPVRVRDLANVDGEEERGGATRLMSDDAQTASRAPH